MYNPKELTIENLMSYKHQVINFTNTAHIIYGVNEFDRGQKNNGSGKSVILEALALILTGNHLRKDVSIRNLIRRGEDSCSVSMTLHNPMLNVELQIQRTFFIKTTKSQQIVIKENGVDQSHTSPTHANEIISEYLGISKEDLLNYYIISKHKYTSFFRQGDAGAKKVVGRFSNIDSIDGVFEKIEEQANEVSLKMEDQKTIQNVEDGKIEAYNTQIIQEQNRNLTEEKDTEKRGYKNSIFVSNNNITQWTQSKKSTQTQITTTEDQIKKLQVRIDNGDTLIQTLDTSILEVGAKILAANNQLTEIKNKKAEADRLLLSEVECPKCTHQFATADSGKDLTQVRNAIPILNKLESEKQTQVTTITESSVKDQQKKTEAGRLLSGLRAQKTQLIESKGRLEKNLIQFGSNIDQANTYIDSQNKLIDALDNAEEKETREKELELLVQKSVEVKNTAQEEINTYLEQLEEKIGLRQQFLKFKTTLVNKTVKVIEFHCNKVLDRMGSSLNVDITGFREKRGGKGLIEKITTKVKREGIEQGIFGQYSAGEGGRIEVSGIIAFQELINSSSPSGGLNLLFLDEIIESIDSEGITGIVKELDENFDKCIFIVTHATYEGVYDKVIRATKGIGEETILSYPSPRD